MEQKIEVGTIISGAWRWSARHPYFYQITGISKTGKTCHARRLKGIVKDNDGYGQNGTMVCEKDNFYDSENKNERFMIKDGMFINRKERMYATIWDGTPETFYTD